MYRMHTVGSEVALGVGIVVIGVGKIVGFCVAKRELVVSTGVEKAVIVGVVDMSKVVDMVEVNPGATGKMKDEVLTKGLSRVVEIVPGSENAINAECT